MKKKFVVSSFKEVVTLPIGGGSASWLGEDLPIRIATDFDHQSASPILGFVCPQWALAYFDLPGATITHLMNGRVGLLDHSIQSLIFVADSYEECLEWKRQQLKRRTVSGAAYPHRGLPKERRRMLSGAYGIPYRVPVYSLYDDDPTPIGWEWSLDQTDKLFLAI